MHDNERPEALSDSAEGASHDILIQPAVPERLQDREPRRESEDHSQDSPLAALTQLRGARDAHEASVRRLHAQCPE